MEQVLTPPPIIDQFKQNDVTHVIWLPDSETNFMYELMTREEGLKIVPVCREGDSIRGLGIDLEFPLVMMIGYRGWTRHGITKDSAARFTEPILHAYGINYYLIESNDDVGRISDAFEEAERTRKPVACLLGAEYS